MHRRLVFRWLLCFSYVKMELLVTLFVDCDVSVLSFLVVDVFGDEFQCISC